MWQAANADPMEERPQLRKGEGKKDKEESRVGEQKQKSTTGPTAKAAKPQTHSHATHKAHRQCHTGSRQ